MTLDWMLLRILLRRKQKALDFHNGQAAAAAGINRGAYTGFLNGNRPTLSTENTLPLLAWLGIYDYREVCNGDGSQGPADLPGSE